MSKEILLRIEHAKQEVLSFTSISVQDELKSRDKEDKACLVAHIVEMLVEDLEIDIDEVLEKGELLW